MNAEQTLWNRYKSLVEEWNADERERAVTRYRREHQPPVPVPAAASSPLDRYPVTPADHLPAPAPTPDFAYRPVPLPDKPAEATIADALKWGVGGGAGVALIWFLMMFEGWRPGSGHVIPALVVVGLFLAIIGGAATAGVRYAIRKSQHQSKMINYAAAAEYAARAVNSQQLASEENRLAKMDDDADRLLWERVRSAPAAALPHHEPATVQDVQLTDTEILAAFDGQTPQRISTVLESARQAGTAPESTNDWLGATAASMKKAADALSAMEARGWNVQITETGTARDVAVIESADLPAPTTVMFHNATPDQLKSAEEHIAAYDDAALSYRPIPGTDHKVPEGLPTRVVHVNSHWKTLGLDTSDEGYGMIGTDSYLTDWDHLLATIETAEL